MGQKVSPIANRLALSKRWRSRWVGGRSTPYFILEDATVRRIIRDRYGKNGLIERIEIERDAEELRVGIYTAKPGLVIGRGGQGISGLRQTMERTLQSLRETDARRLLVDPALRKVIPKRLTIDIYELKDGDARAGIVAQTVATQLERRMAYRRAANMAIERAFSRGVKGIRVTVAGRLGGVEISRRETFSKGQMPISSLKEDIDFAQAESMTTYGTLGVKVWIYRGEQIRFLDEPLPRRSF